MSDDSHELSLSPQPSALSPRERTHWDALSDATELLEDISDSPQLDAELLLRQVSGIERVQLFLRYDMPLPAEVDERFRVLVERRRAGEPIPYILGRRWFRTIELEVDERVLIPRPETERFVDDALAWLACHPGRRRVVDVGTGSGAIALALATELGRRATEVHIVATDISADALRVARHNRDRLELRDAVDLVASDLLSAFAGPFDLILANLPYLRPDQRHPSTRREPPVALFGGPDGFDLHRALLRQATTKLAPGGLYVGEIDPTQAAFGVVFASEATGLPARVDPDYAGDGRYLLVGDLPPRRSRS